MTVVTGQSVASSLLRENQRDEGNWVSPFFSFEWISRSFKPTSAEPSSSSTKHMGELTAKRTRMQALQTFPAPQWFHVEAPCTQRQTGKSVVDNNNG